MKLISFPHLVRFKDLDDDDDDDNDGGEKNLQPNCEAPLLSLVFQPILARKCSKVSRPHFSVNTSKFCNCGMLPMHNQNQCCHTHLQWFICLFTGNLYLFFNIQICVRKCFSKNMLIALCVAIIRGKICKYMILWDYVNLYFKKA